MQKKLPSINSAHGSETRNIINEIIKAINDRGLEILSESSFLTWLDENGIKHREEVATFDDLPSSDSLNTVRGVLEDSKIYIKKEDGWVPFQSIDISKINEVERTVEDITFVASKTGANGDGVSDDTAALQMLIDEANGNAITLRADGTYIISNTLKLKPDTKFYGNNAKITVNANVEGFLVPANAIVKDFKIKSGISGYSKLFIKLDDKSGYNVTTTGYADNITFEGDDGYLAKGIGCEDGNIRGVITYHTGNNLKFSKMHDCLYFKNSNASSWYNGNSYTNVNMYDCVNYITFEGKCDGNNVKGAQLQPTSRTRRGIRCNGSNNKFDVTLWDFYIFDNVIPYDFSDGFYNEINTNEYLVNVNEVKGNSTNIINSNVVDGVVLPKVSTESSYVISKNGSAINSLKNYLGNQDDVLTLVDKKSNIEILGKQPESGLISQVFRMNSFVVTWQLSPGEEVTIKITPDKPFNYLDIFGALFTSAYPDYVVLAYESNDGTKTERRFDDLNNIFVYSHEIYGAALKNISVTFGVKNPKTIRLSRIFASSRNMKQSSFLQTDGGEVHGDLIFDSFETGVILTSPDGTKHRLRINSAGQLTTYILPQ